MKFFHSPFIAAAIICHLVSAVVAAPYRGAIIDAHGHIGGSFDMETMARVTSANGVSRQVLMARYYGGPAREKDLPGRDELSLAMAAAHPGRFFPLVGMQRPELTGSYQWHHPTGRIEALLQEVEQKLASGKFHGIGELIVRHFAYSTGRHAELDHPIYSTFTRRLSEIARRFDVPIVIHMEGEPGRVAEFSRLIDEFGSVRYVWAHNCGRSKAPVIREMLTRHPNLMCDLGGMTNIGKQNYGTGRPRMEPYTALMEQAGTFLPQMKQVYEAFPDRFMIGMDVAHANGMNHRNYSGRVRRFRHLLGQLSPSTAQRIAAGNAQRIFKMD